MEAGATSLIFQYIGMPTEDAAARRRKSDLGCRAIDRIPLSLERRLLQFRHLRQQDHQAVQPALCRLVRDRIAQFQDRRCRSWEGWRHHEQKPPGSMDYTFSGTAPSAPDAHRLIDRAICHAEPRERTAEGDLGLFAQISGRLRADAEPRVRFDYLNAYAEPPICRRVRSCRPATSTRFPSCRCWQDIVPRLGAAYDVFGNGQDRGQVQPRRYVAGSGR